MLYRTQYGVRVYGDRGRGRDSLPEHNMLHLLISLFLPTLIRAKGKRKKEDKMERKTDTATLQVCIMITAMDRQAV